MKTVLLLSTYPIRHPRHGGQVRLSNIAKTFKEEGWRVLNIAVYEPEGYSPSMVDEHDVAFPVSSKYRICNGSSAPLINDYLAGRYAVAEDGGFSKILKRLPQSIEAIHVEQPWLWPLAKKIKTLPQYSNACLIYGSANIEAPLKLDILKSYDVAGADDFVSVIDELERMAAREADVTVAVTQADYDVISSWGASNILLAPNGISPWIASEERLESWKKKLPDVPWLLYVASAHPPNFTGFNECLAGSLACIPPDSRLVVAGSVGEHLYSALLSGRWGELSVSRLQLLNVLSDEDLAAVKSLAHGFLLPIPHGGGSNIKTAEALYSGKYVIGTESAFRGFETFTNEPSVIVARSPAEFHLGIREVLSKPKTLDGIDSVPRVELTWKYTLRELPSRVESSINKVLVNE